MLKLTVKHTADQTISHILTAGRVGTATAGRQQGDSVPYLGVQGRNKELEQEEEALFQETGYTG
jgi:hypothetical protein